jgi:hypothetical protein
VIDNNQEAILALVTQPWLGTWLKRVHGWEVDFAEKDLGIRSRYANFGRLIGAWRKIKKGWADTPSLRNIN